MRADAGETAAARKARATKPAYRLAFKQDMVASSSHSCCGV
jgi:hypothetical protein